MTDTATSSRLTRQEKDVNLRCLLDTWKLWDVAQLSQGLSDVLQYSISLSFEFQMVRNHR